MIVTVKNEVNEPVVRQRAHRNKGLRGPSSGSTRDKTKIDFSSRKFGLYQHALAALEHASILSPSNSLAAWERKRIRFNGDMSTVRFISTTDRRTARATLERARVRAPSYERAAEWGTFVSFFFLSFVYQVKTLSQQDHYT